MSVDGVSSKSYLDFQALGELKRQARANDPAATRETARQFETLFAKMMLQSMREASQGDELFDTQESQMYRGMFDDQLALEMTKGKGLGIADMMVQQLMRADIAAQAAAQSAANGGDGKAQLAPTLERVVPNLAPTMERVAAPLSPLSNKAPDLKALPPLYIRGEATTATPTTPPPTTAAPTITPTSDVAPLPPPIAGTRRAFLESILPAAEKAAKALGVSPRSIMAQAALETGWGRSMPTDASGRPSMNLFGIKATGGWQGATTAALTTEFVAGRSQRQVETFRAYSSMEDSISDHARLLSRSPRYAAVLNPGDDTHAYATALQRGGYATDPNYARKLVAVAESIDQVMAGRDDLRSTGNTRI